MSDAEELDPKTLRVIAKALRDWASIATVTGEEMSAAFIEGLANGLTKEAERIEVERSPQ